LLKLEGEVDLVLQRWQPVKGIANLIEANDLMKETLSTKMMLNERIGKFRELCKTI
jgi:hypothetical protein